MIRENDNFKRQLQDSGSKVSKLSEVEYKVGVLSSEIERLNTTLESRTRENMDISQDRDRIAAALDAKIKEIRVLHERLGETDLVTRNMQGLNEKVSRLTIENDTLANDVREGQ